MTIIGNVTSDPELRYSNAGNAFMFFSVAVNHWSKNSAGEVTESTDYWDCKLFGEQAENAAATFRKGNRVIVTGNVKSDSWTDQASGQKRSKFVLYVEELGPSLRWARCEIERISKNGAAGGTSAPRQYAAAAPASAPVVEDDNPFM